MLTLLRAAHHDPSKTAQHHQHYHNQQHQEQKQNKQKQPPNSRHGLQYEDVGDFLVPDPVGSEISMPLDFQYLQQPLQKRQRTALKESPDTQNLPKPDLAVGRKTFPCTAPGCSKVFKDRSGLRKHRASKHSFSCPHSDCKTTCPTFVAFLHHMHIHENQEDKAREGSTQHSALPLPSTLQSAA